MGLEYVLIAARYRRPTRFVFFVCRRLAKAALSGIPLLVTAALFSRRLIRVILGGLGICFTAARHSKFPRLIIEKSLNFRNRRRTKLLRRKSLILRQIRR